MSAPDTFAGTAAGVPYVAVAPITARADVPIVVIWHLLDPPRTEAAMRAAIPLDGLDAWRIYLGLPMSGSRLPAGGTEEVMKRLMQDAVLQVHGPITAQAVSEFEPALVELRTTLGIAEGPVAVVGGSLGSAVALLSLLESPVRIAAAVAVSPLVQVRTFIDAVSGQFGAPYVWSPESTAVADRLDFVARADDFVERGAPPVLLIIGAEDDRTAFGGPAALLRDELGRRYADPTRVDLREIQNMEHALSDEPGIDAAPQTPHAAEADALAVDWLRRHLMVGDAG
ncbi:MAG: prolyl oligopeptidase family serine peptidase [Mycobacteriales bacterium]